MVWINVAIDSVFCLWLAQKVCVQPMNEHTTIYIWITQLLCNLLFKIVFCFGYQSKLIIYLKLLSLYQECVHHGECPKQAFLYSGISLKWADAGMQRETWHMATKIVVVSINHPSSNTQQTECFLSNIHTASNGIYTIHSQTRQLDKTITKTRYVIRRLQWDKGGNLTELEWLVTGNAMPPWIILPCHAHMDLWYSLNTLIGRFHWPMQSNYKFPRRKHAHHLLCIGGWVVMQFPYFWIYKYV